MVQSQQTLHLNQIKLYDLVNLEESKYKNKLSSHFTECSIKMRRGNNKRQEIILCFEIQMNLQFKKCKQMLQKYLKT